MPEKHIIALKERLAKAKDKGQSYHGEVIFKVADSKFVSVETKLKIDEQKKIILT